jgi:hypothetical protein
LRSPIASQGEGGALGEEEARKRGNTVGIRDQAMDLAALNFLPTTRAQHGEDRNNRIYFREEGKPQNLENALATLPTPTTRDYKDGSEPHERDGLIQTDTIARAIFNSGEVLLPTTRTSMANGATRKEVEAGNPKSRIEAEVLLMPTPTAVDGNTVAKSELDANDPKHRLKVAAQVLARDGVNWGKFEPAIRRWENVLGRPAPAPTKPDGKNGAHRLSSSFTEWMMGLPEGWITDVGLTRNEELKACGNGVVPQQAELALRMLLEGISAPRGSEIPMLPTATPSDAYIGDLKSVQRKPGSMHSVNLAVAVDGIQKGEM